MGKYSKVIKKVEFETRLAVNGWLDTTCKTCGWTENHDVHVRLGYRFCPGCGGSVTKDRFKYDIRYADKCGEVHCGRCKALLGFYDDITVASMKFCPYCGDMFNKSNLQRLVEEIEV